MKTKRGWAKPVVTRVKLDPRQAVMDVCARIGYGGAWMSNPATPHCMYGIAPGTGSFMTCPTSPRGSFGTNCGVEHTHVNDPQNAGS